MAGGRTSRRTRRQGTTQGRGWTQQGHRCSLHPQPVPAPLAVAAQPDFAPVGRVRVHSLGLDLGLEVGCEDAVVPGPQRWWQQQQQQQQECHPPHLGPKASPVVGHPRVGTTSRTLVLAQPVGHQQQPAPALVVVEAAVPVYRRHSVAQPCSPPLRHRKAEPRESCPEVLQKEETVWVMGKTTVMVTGQTQLPLPLDQQRHRLYQARRQARCVATSGSTWVIAPTPHPARDAGLHQCRNRHPRPILAGWASWRTERWPRHRRRRPPRSSC